MERPEPGTESSVSDRDDASTSGTAPEVGVDGIPSASPIIPVTRGRTKISRLAMSVRTSSRAAARSTWTVLMRFSGTAIRRGASATDPLKVYPIGIG